VENNRTGLKQGTIEERLFGEYSTTDSGDATTTANTATVSDGTAGEQVIPVALMLLFSSFVMAEETFTHEGSKRELVKPPSDGSSMVGESFTYDGSNPKLKMEVTFHVGASTTPMTKIDNVLSPTGSVSGNDITIDYVTGTPLNYAMGGYSDTGGLVENNRIGLKQGTVEKDLFGGYSYTPSGNTDAIASYNTTTISGGSVGGHTYGGYSDSGSGSATANYNTVTISGGSVGGEVMGGYIGVWYNSATVTATDNTVNLDGPVSFVGTGIL
jgi:hypothetical protein